MQDVTDDRMFKDYILVVECQGDKTREMEIIFWSILNKC